jgi:hypothetical protein
MEAYAELKADMKAIQEKMVESKKNERAKALKELKRLGEWLGITAGMTRGSLAKGQKRK